MEQPQCRVDTNRKKRTRETPWNIAAAFSWWNLRKFRGFHAYLDQTFCLRKLTYQAKQERHIFVFSGLLGENDSKLHGKHSLRRLTTRPQRAAKYSYATPVGPIYTTDCFYVQVNSKIFQALFTISPIQTLSSLDRFQNT